MAFTLLSAFALYSLWKEHRRSAMPSEDLEAAGGECVEEGGATDPTIFDRSDDLSPAVSSSPRISTAEHDAAVLAAAQRGVLEVAGFLGRGTSARRAPTSPRSPPRSPLHAPRNIHGREEERVSARGF